MSVLVPIAHGCEDLEFVSITDILARASLKVSVASIEPPGELVRLMKGVRVEPDGPPVRRGGGNLAGHCNTRRHPRSNAVGRIHPIAYGTD